MKKLLGLLSLLGTAAVVIFLAAQIYDFTVHSMKKEGGTFIIDVSPNRSFYSLVPLFKEQGIPLSPLLLRLYLSLHANPKLRVGEYEIQRKWPLKKALDRILSGEELMHKLTVKEGHNVYDISLSLQTDGYFQKVRSSPEAFLKIMRDPKLMERMEIPKSAGSDPTGHGQPRSLEGYLFPETYSYSKYYEPRKLVVAMLDEFTLRALPLLNSHPEWGQTPEGRYRLLTLASIVEKESGQAAEQPIIASVFWNRIHKGMRLQSDPTTIYALLPDFDGNLKRMHLTTPSFYNTYTLPGLPAGPISNPGETAIRAVLNPTPSKYFYFVGRGDGTHIFAEDYRTHNENVRKFQLGQ